MSSKDSTAEPSRYVVGLDLGTTNCALAYVDTVQSPRQLQTFAVAQLVAAGVIEARETLPSFLYHPASGEFAPASLRLPWQHADVHEFVGILARDQGTAVPGRVVSSAKSWLSHTGVDRTADLLPWQGADDVSRWSPVAVSARYLQHYREAWDAAHPDHPLAEQDFVLTLPASFDEVARELTVRAAQLAGLKRVTLIEEPQAAFYAWIDKHSTTWDQLVSPGQKILICDIGGGTTDFTLIRVRRGPQGLVQFHRVAVGDHLILGGDNLDLALARHLERRITGNGQLDSRTWSALVRSCRQIKETFLGPHPPAEHTLTLAGTGSRLIGGGLQVQITRDEVFEVLLDGFFPRVGLDEKPQRGQSGFREFGLPYAPDPAITRYLAQFLTTHRHAGDDETETPGHDPARPDLLLFNGGVFESTAIRQRIVDQLRDWFGHDGWSVTVLDNERLDLAVARGAAYYGMVRRGQGVRIAAGLARTYYVGVEASPASGDSGTALATAICLLPAGLEAGQDVDLTQRSFALRLSEPIELPLYVSSVRLTDRPGDVIVVEREQVSALPPIRTVFKAGKGLERGTVAIRLKARLTEIGTLDLWCTEVEGSRSWKLLFDVRSATQTDIAPTAARGNELGVLDEGVRQAALTVIEQIFRKGGGDPDSLMKRLSEALSLPRGEWPPTLLRQLWEGLVEVEPSRRLSPQHEARWLNLAGYCLRPGYGVALDDWRVQETWKRVQGKITFASASSRAEASILWRRVAGGLTSGQQQLLAGPILASLKESSRGNSRGRGAAAVAGDLAEQCRLIGSLEWLSPTFKEQAGEVLFALAEKEVSDQTRTAALWAIGRLGARQPVYGPLNTVVAPEVISRWLTRIDRLPGSNPMEAFAMMQLARRTGDRYRDVSEGVREDVLRALDRLGASDHQLAVVQEISALDEQEQGVVFGESLPRGLRIL